MGKEIEGSEKVKYPQYKKCTNGGKGFCAAAGCMAQAWLDNLADLGDTPAANKRRTKIKKEAKAKGCGALPLQG